MTFLTQAVFKTGPLPITTSGFFLLAHGLLTPPKSVSLVLTNLVAEFGFPLGTTLLGRLDTDTVGFIVDPINVRIQYINKTTVFKVAGVPLGAKVSLTNANWTAEFTFK